MVGKFLGALGLLVVLLLDPWAILAAGFWLSFSAVGVLLYVGSAGIGRVVGWRQHLAAWSLVQWAATLASLPVLLLVFQQFSLISPLANALAIPVFTFLLVPPVLLANRAYAAAQLLSFEHYRGWFFWSYRTEDTPAWSLRDCVERGWLPSRFR